MVTESHLGAEPHLLYRFLRTTPEILCNYALAIYM